jgi:hypothetical protein
VNFRDFTRKPYIRESRTVPNPAQDFSKKWAEVEKMGSEVKSISDR